jgi:hypothetical protein
MALSRPTELTCRLCAPMTALATVWMMVPGGSGAHEALVGFRVGRENMEGWAKNADSTDARPRLRAGTCLDSDLCACDQWYFKPDCSFSYRNYIGWPAWTTFLVLGVMIDGSAALATTWYLVRRWWITGHCIRCNVLNYRDAAASLNIIACILRVTWFLRSCSARKYGEGDRESRWSNWRGSEGVEP